MKKKFRSWRFKEPALELIREADGILMGYRQQGYQVTLRQLYYRLVSKNLIENNDRSYERLRKTMTKARYAGLIDWGVFVDRARQSYKAESYDDVKDYLDNVAIDYRLDRWEGQEYYVEVVTEKDALTSVLGPLANKWDVCWNVNRGYGSTTRYYQMAQRLMSHKSPMILYFGDHDPSGKHMMRDTEKRLKEFGCNVEIDVIALTMDQVKKYKPLPNNVKLSDKRSGEYIRKYGRSCWEVDALEPPVLKEVFEEGIKKYLDVELFEEVKQREEDDMEALQEFLDDYVEE